MWKCLLVADEKLDCQLESKWRSSALVDPFSLVLQTLRMENKKFPMPEKFRSHSCLQLHLSLCCFLQFFTISHSFRSTWTFFPNLKSYFGPTRIPTLGNDTCRRFWEAQPALVFTGGSSQTVMRRSTSMSLGKKKVADDSKYWEKSSCCWEISSSTCAHLQHCFHYRLFRWLLQRRPVCWWDCSQFQTLNSAVGVSQTHLPAFLDFWSHLVSAVKLQVFLQRADGRLPLFFQLQRWQQGAEPSSEDQPEVATSVSQQFKELKRQSDFLPHFSRCLPLRSVCKLLSCINSLKSIRLVPWSPKGTMPEDIMIDLVVFISVFFLFVCCFAFWGKMKDVWFNSIKKKKKNESCQSVSIKSILS